MVAEKKTTEQSVECLAYPHQYGLNVSEQALITLTEGNYVITFKFDASWIALEFRNRLVDCADMHIALKSDLIHVDKAHWHRTLKENETLKTQLRDMMTVPLTQQSEAKQ